MPELWYIEIGEACGGVFVKEGRVVLTAPIFGWMRGAYFERLRPRLRQAVCLG